jgi:alkanesulfonate monooxygenase SsuD/methylene tetrahydromethanopterin reductase-like flavin-dependent oxidoreductase (luciferase family)
MAELVGEHCDGILRLGPLDFLKDEVLPAFDRGARKAGKDPSSLSKMAFVDTSYHPEMAKAVAKARLYGGVLIPSVIRSSRTHAS